MKSIDLRNKYLILLDRYGENPFINPLLKGFSLLYGLGVYLRRKSYAKGLISVKRLPCPVISIGNITVGGTGKTPAVGMIARFLLDHGLHPVILTRGYKRSREKDLRIVSDSKKVLALPEEAGDEPYMLARWLPGVPIIAGKDRYESAIFAMNNFMADCFVLDDGFQHIRLFRDIDILVINARDPFGNGKLLPWGRLREPLSSINRASLILLNKSIPGQCLDYIIDVISKYNSNAPIVETSYKPVCIAPALNDKKRLPISKIKGKSVLAFSGIADPCSFIELLKGTGAVIVNALIFSDHHWFSESDLAKIKNIANSSFAEFIITTEKDGVRLPSGCKGDIYILTMEMKLKKSQFDLENIMHPIIMDT